MKECFFFSSDCGKYGWLDENVRLEEGEEEEDRRGNRSVVILFHSQKF